MNVEVCTARTTNSSVHYSSLSSAFLKCSVLSLLLIAASAFAVVADHEANPAACNISEEETDGLSRDLSTDVHAVQEYRNTIAQILKEEKFEELDCLADHARSSKERFPGGMWKLHELYGALGSPIQYPTTHATQEDWNPHLKRLQRWVTTHPKSITARVALAAAYLNNAWDARGTGFSDSVSDGGWKLFSERTAEAKRILEEASLLPTKCPEWYAQMQVVAQNESWDTVRMRALFDEANKFELGYYYYARALAICLLPKWSGEEGATEKFILEATDRIGGDQGDVLYFQIASSSDVVSGWDESPHLSWERIEKGFEATEKQYGISMLNLNRIAFLASHFGDGDSIVADKALTRIGTQWDSNTWSDEERFKQAKKWASDAALVESKNRAMEAPADANLRTPEGLRYKQSFEKTYRKLVRQCALTQGAGVEQWEGKFETLTRVGANGSVEDVRIYAMGPVAICLYEKLNAFRQKKAKAFAPPPQAAYWVRLDLDWAAFAPVAAK